MGLSAMHRTVEDLMNVKWQACRTIGTPPVIATKKQAEMQPPGAGQSAENNQSRLQIVMRASFPSCSLPGASMNWRLARH